MNQEEIGKFIAELRKEQGLTQQQLADRLGVSNKTISKWECGNGMPELSLILPLCETLGISINELLSGERLTAEEFSKKAEENIMSLITEKESLKRNQNSISTIIVTIITIVQFSAIMFENVGSSQPLSPSLFYWASFGILYGFISFLFFLPFKARLQTINLS